MINDPVSVDLKSVVDSIIHQIGPMSCPDDVDFVRLDSFRLLKRGWLPNEIIDFARCSEYVDKTIPEDIALTRMADIEKRVMMRLGIKS